MINREDKTRSILILALYAAIPLAVLYGYINNIVQFAQSNDLLLQSNLLIARLIGIFIAPLGVVLGFV
jgi:hypothetical protein